MSLTTPPDEPDSGGSRTYALALLARWPLILQAVIVAVLVALLVAHSVSKTYEAEADLLVTPISSNNDTLAGLGLLQESSQSRGALTASRFIQSPEVARAVASEIGGNPNRLLHAIQVTPLGQSDIVTITSHASSPARAAQIANAFANVTIAQRTRRFQRVLKTHVAQLSDRVVAARARGDQDAVTALSAQFAALVQYVGSPDPTLDVARIAVRPTAAVQPRTKLAIMVALLGALLLGAAIVWALELVDPRIREEGQMSRRSVVARLPALSRRAAERFFRGGRVLPADTLHRYRLLVEDVTAGYAGVGEGSVILVAALGNERSKSVTALTVAALTASSGRRTIIVDADPRRPEITKSLSSTSPSADLCDLLAGTDVDDVARPVPQSDGRLSIVPIHAEADRRTGAKGVDSFGRAAWAAAYEALRAHAEVIVVNAPTGADAAQIALLASVADVTLVTVEFGKTSRKAFDALFETLSDQTEYGIVLFSRTRTGGELVQVPVAPIGASAEPSSSPDVVKELPIRGARSAEPNR